MSEDAPGALDTARRFFALERDVLVLSLAMFAFSLGFQMTNRFLPDYVYALGASGVVAGLFGTVAQHRLYDASEDTVGSSFEGLS